MKTFLIMCGKSKLSKLVPARELYTSERFRMSRLIAENYGDQWFIVSAKHGLLHPETKVEPYDFPIDKLNENEKNKWVIKIYNDLKIKITKKHEIIVLGEEHYFSELVKMLLDNEYQVFNIPKRVNPNQMKKWLQNAQPSSIKYSDLNKLYDLLKTINHNIFEAKKIADNDSNIKIPTKGLYLFYQNDESRLFDKGMRIIRVGTHGVSEGSKSTLVQRLRQHVGNNLGDGNHRSSVFRLHVGNAIMNKYNFECPTWNDKTCTSKLSLEKELSLEKKVSDYIWDMKVLLLKMEDRSSKFSDRAYLEQNIIALIAGISPPLDIAKENWLGYSSPNELIRYSSLWNINHTKQHYDKRFFNVLDSYIKITLGHKRNPKKSLAPKDWYRKAKNNYLQEELNF